MNASAGSRQTPVIDVHNDSIVAYIRRDNIGLAGETSPQRRARSGDDQHSEPFIQPPAAADILLVTRSKSPYTSARRPLRQRLSSATKKIPAPVAISGSIPQTGIPAFDPRRYPSLFAEVIP